MIITVGTLNESNSYPLIKGESAKVEKEDDGFWFYLDGEAYFMGDDEEVRDGSILIANPETKTTDLDILRKRIKIQNKQNKKDYEEIINHPSYKDEMIGN